MTKANWFYFEQKPVGKVWVALVSDGDVISKKLNLVYNREKNILISAISALNLLRLELIKTF